MNQPLSHSDVVLLLVEQETAGAAEYIQTLKEVDGHGCPVAVIPVSKASSSKAEVARLLGEETLRIDFSKGRFRLTDCTEANLPDAPAIVRRALQDDPASVADDLESADLLVLQGHSGPVDGGFGRWLTVCSRHLHQPGGAAVFPCFGTDRCFRQEQYGRDATSTEGLVDAASLRAPLLILLGCGTLVVPGTLFSYETSIARSVMASGVRAAVMTHGVNAAPFSALIVFLAELAGGRTLGEAVRQANYHVQALRSPSTIEGRAASPLILVGNPEARVLGLPLSEEVAVMNDGALEFTLAEESIPAATGAIVALANVPARDGPFDLSCGDGRWARGALREDGGAYIWVSGRETPPRDSATPGRVTVRLPRRPANLNSFWAQKAKWLQANRGWLEHLASLVEARGGAADGLRSLTSLWSELSEPLELLAFAAPPQRRRSISPPLDEATGHLTDLIRRLDRLTAEVVAAATRYAGARLSRVWHPQWLNEGFARVEERCACGCPVSGIARRHPVLDLVRVVLACPACGPIGDVTGRAAGSNGSVEYTPAVTGIPEVRSVARGDTVAWPVQRLDDDRVEGFACAAMLDAFRQRHVLTEVVGVPPNSRTSVEMHIGEDWPPGLSQVVIAVTFGAEISFLDFDIVVGVK